MDRMTAAELREAIDAIWGGNRTHAARDLGIGARTIRACIADPELSSARPISAELAAQVRALRAQFPQGLPAADPGQTIGVLHAQLARGDRAAAQAAGAILAAALDHARQHMSAEEIRSILSGQCQL